MKETNKLTPEFFYERVAKKTGVSKDQVKELYSKYLNRLQEVSRLDNKIMVRGLGTFELNPKKVLSKLYALDRLLDMARYKEIVESSEPLPDWIEERLVVAGKLIKHLNQLEYKHGYIKGSVEKFWANSRRLDQFVDSKGCRRRSSGEAISDLQELSKEERS